MFNKLILLFHLLILVTFCGCQYHYTPFPDDFYTYSPAGDILRTPVTQPVAKSSNICSEIMPDGSFKLTSGNFQYSGQPGEYIFPVLTDRQKIWLLSEKDSPFMQLVQWDTATGKTTVPYPCSHDISGIIATYNNGNHRLHALQYFSGGEINYHYFDLNMARMEQILHRNGVKCVIWHEKSPVAEKWLAELLYTDRENRWAECDLHTFTYRYLSPPVPISPTIRYKISYHANDGTLIDAVLTIPEKFTEQLPLIIFPHGGPGTSDFVLYDFRAAFFAEQGFAVLQPNYRGSRHYGKKFRTDGWRAAGIKQALNDIICGIDFLKNNSMIDTGKCFIFGGSWGGFLVTALLTAYPDLFKGGVAFFGVYDLPLMLQSFPERSCAHRALDKLQYGDIDNAEDMKDLDAISPLKNIKNLSAPLMFVHFTGDNVIDWHQAELLENALIQADKTYIFYHGHGNHSFNSRSEELEYLQKAVSFFRNKVK